MADIKQLIKAYKDALAAKENSKETLEFKMNDALSRLSILLNQYKPSPGWKKIENKYSKLELRFISTVSDSVTMSISVDEFAFYKFTRNNMSFGDAVRINTDVDWSKAEGVIAERISMSYSTVNELNTKYNGKFDEAVAKSAQIQHNIKDNIMSFMSSPIAKAAEELIKEISVLYNADRGNAQTLDNELRVAIEIAKTNLSTAVQSIIEQNLKRGISFSETAFSQFSMPADAEKVFELIKQGSKYSADANELANQVGYSTSNATSYKNQKVLPLFWDAKSGKPRQTSSISFKRLRKDGITISAQEPNKATSLDQFAKAQGMRGFKTEYGNRYQAFWTSEATGVSFDAPTTWNRLMFILAAFNLLEKVIPNYKELLQVAKETIK